MATVNTLAMVVAIHSVGPSIHVVLVPLDAPIQPTHRRTGRAVVVDARVILWSRHRNSSNRSRNSFRHYWVSPGKYDSR